MRQALRLLVLLAFGAAAIWVTATVLDVRWTDVEHLGEPRNVLEVGESTVRIPVPDGDGVRLLPAVPPTTTGEYAFMFDDETGPVRYDPCLPVEWVLNPDGMPKGVEQLVRDAVQSVEDATGLKFVYAGLTTEDARFERPLFQSRYGDGFAPIIVGFSNEGDTPDLAGSVTGLGGSTAVFGAYGDQRYLRSGVVIMDTDDIRRILRSPQGPPLAQAVIAHELGHVVGLAHVADVGELMHDSNLRTLDWGPGDLQGLAIAGNGACEAA
jgi:hypothetical protein